MVGCSGNFGNGSDRLGLWFTGVPRALQGHLARRLTYIYVDIIAKYNL
jgi:hypothetical protein